MHPRVLIVAEHASLRFGGEAALPLHFFVGLRKRGVEAWLIVHARTRAELQTRLGSDINRVTFIEDDWFHRLMWKLGNFLPDKVSYHSTGLLSRLRTQITARRLAKNLVASHAIDVVHQPIPVSPKEPSIMAGLGAPVIIGPMNGNMSYPPALAKRPGQKPRSDIVLKSLRFLANQLHHILPGKKLAELLLVANERTRIALPTMNRGKVKTLVENGVDPDLWQPVTKRRSRAEDGLKIVFMGRLIELKRVDLAIVALFQLRHIPGLRLTVIGDGPERPKLESLALKYGVGDRVEFLGWREQNEASILLEKADCLILPSIHECGGAVVLEAMSIGLPVIATAWGGPLDYITPDTGFLVEPASEAALVEGFATAIECLARDPDLARRMGEAGRSRVLEHFTWPSKIDEILMHYRDVTGQNG